MQIYGGISIDKCVVRNQAYRKSSISIRERHNERKNLSYSNGDIVKDRATLNVHYKACEGTYTEQFDKLVADGVISTRGLRQDAKVFDEFVFDVNSSYFDRNGSYEFAKRFYEDAYQFAVKEAGGEQYILSAVLHADERNKALSEQLGRDVYHYHLHVVYVPVVDKEVKWTARCKDKSLVGTSKEFIKQVSHSKRWLSEKALDEQGNPIIQENGKVELINSYSLLQDRYFEHMRSAGYHDIQRGERGSTAEHLSVLDYKIQQDSKRAEGLEVDIQAKEEKLSSLSSKVAVVSKVSLAHSDIEAMAKKNLSGKMALELNDWKRVSALAKEGITLKAGNQMLKKSLATANERLEKERDAYRRLYEKARPYLDADKLAPDMAQAALEQVIRQAKHKAATKQISQQRKDSPDR